MMARRRIGILGGTFDPVHLGHLGAALAARQALVLERVLLIPSNVPPHRPNAPVAPGRHRLAMVALAVARIDGLEASDLELRRDGPSFTAATLRALHAEGLDRRDLYFITGADAFAEIATWAEYPAVVDLAHFVVIARPGHDVCGFCDRLPGLASRMRTIATTRRAETAEQAAAAGEAGASDEPGNPAIWLVESATPDVSSSQIRDRIREGRPLTGLVPPLVERYILRHDLYRPPQASGGISQEKTPA